MSEYKKKAVILGAGGFIGSHMVKRLKAEGYWVRGVDLKYPEFSQTEADEFIIGDLRDKHFCEEVLIYNSINEPQFDEVYNFAFMMGGAGYIFTGENDLDIMSSNLITHNLIQLNKYYKKIFYSSSACVYNKDNQVDIVNPICTEESAYPANPDSEYGITKLYDERLYLTLNRLTKKPVRIARFHNIFGPCFDDKTEVLTKNGWKFFENLEDNDKIASLSNGKMIYQNFIDKQKYIYNGDMYKVKSKSVDQLVTKDHKLYISTKTTKTINKEMEHINTSFSLKTAKDIKWDSNVIYFTSYCDWDGDNISDKYILDETTMTDGRKLHIKKTVNMKDWFSFIGWFISEGSFFKTPSNYTIVISQSEKANKENCNKIKNLLNNMGIAYSISSNKNHIIISNKQIFDTIIKEGFIPGCYNKHIPKWMLSAKKELLESLFITLMLGDGNKTGRRYNTISKQLADDFSELCIKLGKNPNIIEEKRIFNNKNTKIFRVHICNRKKSDTSRKNRSIEQYNGFVYDVTLPKDHILMIRRNGKVCWSGNCGTWRGGKEKAPAALCRKIIEATDHIEIWGDGNRTRSFLYIDECLEGVRRLMSSNFMGPVNIGSEELISINNLAKMIMSIENKNLKIKHIDGPLGVNGRNSDNTLIKKKLGWAPSRPLKEGLEKTYWWIKNQIEEKSCC